MSILDLTGATRAFSNEWQTPKAGKRTLGPASLPAGYATGGGNSQGGFAAAKINRLTMDFLAGNTSADQDLFNDNKRLRARARSLSINNPFAAKFLQMVKQNVVGEAGILVKSTVTGLNGKQTAQTDVINQRIDEEWKRWCTRGRCTADGKFSFVDFQHMAIVNCGREGEDLTKYVFGRQFNECGFALQPLDNDQLDDTMTQVDLNGSGAEVRMGVEVDQYGKPLAYWLYNRHPSDINGGNRERKRVPADFINHCAIWQRPGQTRGYSWLAPSMLGLNQYGRYSEAVIVAARASAAKFLVIQQKSAEGGDYTGDDEDAEGEATNKDGTQLMDANAGEALVLDLDQEANFIDPRFPTNTHKDFTQTMLREVASGLLCMYPSLANDLEGVNFSSIRAGLIDERDMWRILQQWFAGSKIIPIRLAWLKVALLTTLSDITLTPKQMEQFTVRGRGWEWVDPMKDAQAIILKLGEGLTTYEIECGKLGYDWQELALQRKKEQEFFQANGIVYGVDITGDQGGKGVAAGDEDEAAKAGGGAAKTQNSGGK